MRRIVNLPKPLIIKIPQELNIQNVANDFVLLIENLWDKKGRSIIIDLRDLKFITTAGLSILTAFCKYGIKNNIISRGKILTPQNPNVHEYLNRMKFYEHLNVVLKKEVLNSNNIAHHIHIVEVDGHDKVEEIVTDLVNIFCKTCKIKEDWKSKLGFALAEVLENTYNHSESIINSLVCAQYFPKINQVEICVADCGIGFKNSLIKNIKYREINNDVDGIRKALEYQVTSTPNRNSGEGLYFVSKMVDYNNGCLVIYSGNGYCENNINYEMPFWNGAVVCMKFNLDNQLNFDEIFNNQYKEDIS